MPKTPHFFEPDAGQAQRPAMIRLPLLFLLLALMVFLYWRAFGNKLADLEAQAVFMDQSGTWSVEDRRALVDRSEWLREQWGMQLTAHVFTEQPLLPELSATTLFIGISASTGDAVIILPGLAARAYRDLSTQTGYDLRLALQDDLSACIRSGEQQVGCILTVLDSVNTTLSKY